MAPSSGHLLVPKALKVFRFAIAKTNELIRSKLPTTNATTKAAAQPVPVYAKSHPVHPLAYLKQARRPYYRSFTTQARTFISTATKAQSGLHADRARYPVSRISRTLQQNGFSPFASTLRPNLTGGTLPRTAGGYGLGGGARARYFSHTTGCQAQVINNVNAGIRAFIVGGGKVRYDGSDPLTGEKRFTAVTATQDKARKQLQQSTVSTRGTTIEFRISPTITALSPMTSQRGDISPSSLQTPELLSTLSADFAKALRSLSQVLNDLNRLSTFGELPISLSDTVDGPVLSVRFPGCDGEIVSRLCDEVGVTRGVVKEDDAWEEDKEVQMALLFPLAPSKSEQTESDLDAAAADYFSNRDAAVEEARQERLEWRGAFSGSGSSSIQSELGGAFSLEEEDSLRSRALSSGSLSGYESLEDALGWSPSPLSARKACRTDADGSQDYEGVEGIYRFLQVCDESRRGMVIST